MGDSSSSGTSGDRRYGRIGIGLTLDSVHLKILDVLRSHGRISVSSLAERVGVSRANAYTRMEALRADGVVTGFSARIDHARVGLDVCALVFVSVRQDLWQQFRTALADMPEVEYCAVTTGQHDAMVQVRVPDVVAVHRLVTEKLSPLPAVRATETVIILDEAIRRPYLLPPAGSAGRETAPRAGAAPAGGLGMTRFIRTADGRTELRGGAEGR